MAGKFKKSALTMMLNPSFVSRVCYIEKSEVLSKLDKYSSILVNKCNDSKLTNRTESTPLSISNRNSLESCVKVALNFPCNRTLFNSNGKSLLSGQCLSSIPASNHYCTQSSNSPNAIIPKNLIVPFEKPPEETDNAGNGEEIAYLFPTPRSTLENVYRIVQKKTGPPVPLLMHTLQFVKYKWVCTYDVKWPLEKSFSFTDNSKKTCSTECAWVVLQYLLKNYYIDTRGVPLFLKDDIRVSKVCHDTASRNLHRKALLPENISSPIPENNSETKTANQEIVPPSHKPPADGIYSRTMQDVIDLFPTPKNTLNNFYQIVQKKLESQTPLVTSTHEFVNQKWICTYRLQWPEKIKVTYKNNFKKQSSIGCSWLVLRYLLGNKYIDENGALLERDLLNNLVSFSNIHRSEKVSNDLLLLDESEKNDFAENLKNLTNLFPFPKDTLNKMQKLLKNGDSLPPLFERKHEQVDQKWYCNYDLKWPQEKRFSYSDFAKKEASSKCAYMVLHYLLKNKYIDEIGTPFHKSNKGVLYDKHLSNCYSNALLSVNNLGPISAINTYCTHASRTRKLSKSNEKDSVDIKEVPTLFPTPKNTLGNIFQAVKNEKGQSFALPSPTYKSVNQKWTCTYDLKWPLEKSFSASDNIKRKATVKCAWTILHYLLQNKHIDRKGTAILFNKEDIELLVKKNIPALHLDQQHADKLDQITNLYKHEIQPVIENCKEYSKIEIMTETINDQQKIFEPRFLGRDKYMCEEDVHLPISDYKEEIIETIQQNRVVIVKGEPGCGKSTRLPQYILEGWAREAEESGENCNIIVTEPRRIAAISLADRVASERGEKVGGVIGYKVRFKSEYQKQLGRILYCTNGILLQHFKSDPTLSNYSHIVIDEAHERDINTDLLLNMLRDVMEQNPSLKVIIMSATINAELFQKFFKGSKLIHIPGFTYPVKSHFLDTCKLKLENTNRICQDSEASIDHIDVAKVLMHIHDKKPEGAILCFLPGWEDIRKIRDLIPEQPDLMVLCLHSRLQDSEQWRIFNNAPAGVRKIILATNIAETSVTINDVVYVVDTGIHKETRFDIERGSMCIDNHWISKSNVEQRKGRAGRVKPGECFHLYPKSKLDTLPQFPLPEILRVSLTKVVLDTKAFNSDKKAADFFNNLPSPPKEATVKLAVQELMDLQLIDANEKLTPLGRILHHFQLEPKLAKALINAVIYKCVSPIVDIITIFSSGSEMFSSGLERKEDIRRLKAAYSKSSDHLSVMKIFEIWDQYMQDGDVQMARSFVHDLGLVPSKMHFLKALKEIHFNYIRDGLKTNVLPLSDDFSDSDEMVKAVLLSSLGTFLTHKNWEVVKGRIKKTNVFHTGMNQIATVTPDSVNFKRIPKKSQFLLYINETRSNMRRINLIRESTLVPAIMVLLFSNKELILQDVDSNSFSSELRSKDQVNIKLADSKIGFVMDREHALKIMECRLILTSCYDHYIFQLTEGGGRNRNLDALWSELLGILSDVLSDFKNE